MKDDINQEKLRARRIELAEAIKREIGQAESKEQEAINHRAAATSLGIRLEEVDYLLGNAVEMESENVIPMRKPKEQRTKSSLRYRQPCATTDIVIMAYPDGIEYDRLVDAISEKYGSTKETVKKMLYRMVQEEYAVRKGTRFELTDICRQAWEASPLYKAS